MICTSTVSVLLETLCCPFALAHCLLCVRVFAFLVLGVCYGKFNVISLAFLAILGFFISCSCLNQPAGCTVAEGFTGDFTPRGKCTTITSPAAVVTCTLYSLNQADESHK